MAVDKDLKIVVDTIIDSTKTIINGSPINNIFDVNEEETKYIFVNQTNGNDDNDGSNYDTPVASLKKAYEMIPKFYNNTYKISFLSSDYYVTEEDINALKENKFSNKDNNPIYIMSGNLDFVKIDTYDNVFSLNNILFSHITFQKKDLEGYYQRGTNIVFSNSNVKFNNCEFRYPIEIKNSDIDFTLECKFYTCKNNFNLLTITNSNVDFIGASSFNNEEGHTNCGAINATDSIVNLLYDLSFISMAEDVDFNYTINKTNCIVNKYFAE